MQEGRPPPAVDALTTRVCQRPEARSAATDTPAISVRYTCTNHGIAFDRYRLEDLAIAAKSTNRARDFFTIVDRMVGR